MPATRTRELVTAALIAALIAGTSWFTATVQPVPFSVQTFFVVLAALLLSPPWAGASMGVYVLIGLVGMPVFAGAKAGLPVIFGPTGGYLIGFVVGAFVGALTRESAERAGLGRAVAGIFAAVVVTAAVYTIGVAQLSIVAGMSVGAAIVAGAVPFLVGDAVKAAVAVIVALRLRPERTVR